MRINPWDDQTKRENMHYQLRRSMSHRKSVIANLQRENTRLREEVEELHFKVRTLEALNEGRR